MTMILPMLGPFGTVTAGGSTKADIPNNLLDSRGRNLMGDFQTRLWSGSLLSFGEFHSRVLKIVRVEPVVTKYRLVPAISFAPRLM